MECARGPGLAYFRGVEREVISADGTRLAARVTGRGLPLVMIHGSAGGLDSWNGVSALLRDAFEIWTYARRGYQPSGDCPGEKTFADDVADLVAVAAAAGAPVRLVGGSYGATVALHALVSDPGPFASAVLFEPPLFSAGAGLRPVLAEYRALLRAGRPNAAARLFSARAARAPAELLGPEPGEDPDPGSARVAEAAGCLHDLEAMADDEPDLGRWSRVGRPVLVLQGERTWDPMPATMDALAGALGGPVSRAVLPGQSHFASHTAPGLFAETVRGFLTPS